MQWILQFLIRHRNFTSLALTIILSFIMLNTNLATQQRTARFLAVSIFFPVDLPISVFQHAKNIYGENTELRGDVAALRMKVSGLADQAAENDRLRAMLSMREHASYTLVAARVVAREPSEIYRGCVIDIGRDQGVELHMPVISKDGVVGKVTQVLGNCSYVRLLRDPLERAGVKSARTGETSILQSLDGESFFMNYRQHSDIHNGDTLVTSGYGGVYPRGLPIGTVSDIRNANSPLLKDVYLKPFVDFDRLDEVFVIKMSPSWGALRNQIDSVKVDDGRRNK